MPSSTYPRTWRPLRPPRPAHCRRLPCKSMQRRRMLRYEIRPRHLVASWRASIGAAGESMWCCSYWTDQTEDWWRPLTPNGCRTLCAYVVSSLSQVASSICYNTWVKKHDEQEYLMDGWWFLQCKTCTINFGTESNFFFASNMLNNANYLCAMFEGGNKKTQLEFILLCIVYEEDFKSISFGL